MREPPFTPLQGVSAVMRPHVEAMLCGHPPELRETAARALVNLEAAFTDRFEKQEDPYFVWHVDPTFYSHSIDEVWREAAAALEAVGLARSTPGRPVRPWRDEVALQLSAEYRVTLLVRGDFLPRWRRNIGHGRLARRASSLLDLLNANTGFAVHLDPEATVARLHQLCSPLSTPDQVEAATTGALEQVARAGVNLVDFARVVTSLGAFPGPAEDLTPLALAVLT